VSGSKSVTFGINIWPWELLSFFFNSPYIFRIACLGNFIFSLKIQLQNIYVRFSFKVMAPWPKSRQRAVVCNSKTTGRKLLELDWNICYLLQKLRNYGVPKFIIDYLASFLTRRQQMSIWIWWHCVENATRFMAWTTHLSDFDRWPSLSYKSHCRPYKASWSSSAMNLSDYCRWRYI